MGILDNTVGGAMLGGGGDGGSSGPFGWLKSAFGTVSDFLASPLGRFLINQWSAIQDAKDWDDFESMARESNEQGAQILRDVIGITQSTVRIREDIGAVSPEFRAQIQARINAGTAPDVWLGQFTEEIPESERRPSAIEAAFEVSEEGEALGEKYFDPEGAVARYGERFAPILKGLKALPGEVTAATERVQRMYGDVGAEFERGRADVMGQYGDLRGELAAGREELMGGYEDILGTARGLVSELGEAERLDINRRWTETGTEAQMRLAARGVGGGTVASSLASGIERERGTALLGLQEQTARQRLGVEETFGLPMLSAQERLMGAGINLGAAQAGAAERFVGAGVNLGAARAGALERGGQFYAQTKAGTLAARTGIAGGEIGEYDWAAMNRLNNLYGFGQIPIQAQQWGAQAALNWRPYVWNPPQPNQPAYALPYGGGGERW